MIMSKLTYGSYSFEEWLAYLEKQSPIDKIDLGLERVASVAQKMELLNPDYFLFTVAGTNGKGTTCRVLEAILLDANQQVGVYSSPHLFQYEERIRINDKSPTHAEFVEAFCAIADLQGEIHLTYFEYTTLAALYLFKKAHLKVVILEVGLGGRLDATNILDADIAIITPIDLDHTLFLGSTREQIGFEKAGIFKSDRSQIAIAADLKVPHSILEQAQQKQIPLHCPTPNPNADWQFTEYPNHTWTLEINGDNPKTYSNLPYPKVPVQNAATALVALHYSPFQVNEKQIRQSLPKIALIGRLQQLEKQPDLMVDVAHNPHSARYLHTQISYLMMENNYSALHLVIGMLKDKDIENTIEALQFEFPVYWYCATLSGSRGGLGADIAQLIQYKNNPSTQAINCFDSVAHAIKQAKKQANKSDLILVCGSFHTVSEAFLCLN